jgi:phospholipase C
LPDFSLIEPNMLGGHGDYHPAFGRSFSDAVDLAMDNPSSMLAGEAFLERAFTAYPSATSQNGPNVWNTPLLIGWDEPGGTYDHVPPGPVPPPAAPPGEFGFAFDRSGYRVLAIIVSPWVEPGSVYNEEYRHTSLIATLRKVWGLGEAFSQRDASARTFEHVLSLDTPRDPHTWATVTARPVPEWTMDLEVVGKALSTLGRGMAPALFAKARELGVPLPAELNEPGATLPPGRIVGVLRQVAWHFFPLLASKPGDPPSA